MCQYAILLTAFGCHNTQCMQELTSFEKQMEQARGTFAQYLATTESQLAALQSTKNSTPKLFQGVLDKATTMLSNAAGYGNVTPEEMKFVNRFFENKAQKQKFLADFLQNLLARNGQYSSHIKAIFVNFQERQKTNGQTDATNVLIEVMHQQTIAQLQQPKEITRVQMAQKVLEQKDGVYTISDEDYFRVMLVNSFSMHMFERFFKG